MDQFTVPQFIENEDKILGPITVRQFVILLTAAGLIFIAYKLFNLPIFILVSLLIGGIAGLLGFYKVNGQPFHFFLLHITQTSQRPNLRVWKKEITKSDIITVKVLKEEKKGTATPQPKPFVTEQKLSELSLVVDTGGAYHAD